MEGSAEVPATHLESTFLVAMEGDFLITSQIINQIAERARVKTNLR